MTEMSAHKGLRFLSPSVLSLHLYMYITGWPENSSSFRIHFFTGGLGKSEAWVSYHNSECL